MNLNKNVITLTDQPFPTYGIPQKCLINGLRKFNSENDLAD